MKAITILSMLPVAIVTNQAEASIQTYHFRRSSAYKALAESDREKLETVTRDMTLLGGALERYADDHIGHAAESLDGLVPRYLEELPRDPFATEESAASRRDGLDRTSLAGFGYWYRRGQGSSWIVSSVGLPEFPYLAEREDVGLYLPRETRISGFEPTFSKVCG